MLHDQTEALTMASRIVVLKDGDIMQVGTPRKYMMPLIAYLWRNLSAHQQ